MEHKKSISLVLATALALTFVISVFAFAPSTPEPDNSIMDAMRADIGRIRLGIDAVGRSPEGKILGEYHNPDDVLTRNFALMLAGWFTDDLTAGSVAMTGINQTSGTLTNTEWAKAAGQGSAGQQVFLSDYDATVGAYLVVGNSTQAENKLDNKIISQVGALQWFQNMTYNEDSGNITMVATIIVDAPQTNGISESAIYYTTNAITWCIARDNFAAIPVTLGDSITIQYTLQVGNTGFTKNFEKLLFGTLKRADVGEDQTQIFTNTSGVENTAYVHTDVSTYVLFDVDIDTSGCDGIIVGTNNTAINRSSYGLGTPTTTQISSNTAPLIVNGTTYSNITIASNIVLGSSYSITEAGWFCKNRDTAGTIFTMMLWRCVFSPYAYTANDVMTVSFVVRVG